MNKSFEVIKAPLVVGYKGEIGSFILQGLLRIMPKASNIWCYDINENEMEIEERIRKSDVIFLCVPLQDTMKWFHKYTPLLKDKIIFEQCSLKSLIYEDEKKFIDSGKQFNLFSMHILFRPSATPNKCDRKVALIKKDNLGGMGNGWFDRLDLEIKKITDSEIIWFDNYIEHDIAMATQQALVHRVLLILGYIIKNNNHQTYIGKKVLELTDRIKAGSPELYKIIQSNKYLTKELATFNRRLENFDKLKQIKVD